MLRYVSLAALATAIILHPTPAHAGPDFFAAGIGGTTVQTVTSSAIGGGGGVAFGKYIDVIGEFGRFTNLLPKADLATIAANGNALSIPTGTAAVVGGIPAFYGLGEVRLKALPSKRVTPFVGVGAGVARLKNELSVTANGSDISASSLTPPLTMITSERDALVAFDAGISVKAGAQSMLAVGYRFNNIRSPEEHVNSGYVFGEVRMTFKK